MPAAVNPTQTFQSSVLSGAQPGASQNVNDGQDLVDAASLATTVQNAVNTDAYLAALMLGAAGAPPNVQPPAIASTGPGSGVVRLQTSFLGSAPGALEFYYGFPGDILQVPFAGIFVMMNPVGVPAWTTSTSYSTGDLVASNGAIWAMVSSGTLTSGADAPTGIGTFASPYSDPTINWVNVSSPGAGDDIWTVTCNAPSWATSTGYTVNQYVVDSNSNTWVALNTGVSNSSGSPFPSSPTVGTTTPTDGSGATQITWSSVAFPGQWVRQDFLVPQMRHWGNLNFEAGTTPTWAGDGLWTQAAVSGSGPYTVVVTVPGKLPAGYAINVTRSAGVSGDNYSWVYTQNLGGFTIAQDTSENFTYFTVFY